MSSCKNPLCNIYAIHGFLGLPSDWNNFPSISHPVKIVESSQSMPEWAEQFNSTVKKEKNVKNIILGYSMGGRLAMHALLNNPTLWDGAIIVSAHAGLTTAKERNERLQSDQKWAHRFLNDPWELLMRDWNSNPLFGKNVLLREESSFNRKQLAQQLTHWSLGAQEPLLEPLSTLSLPLLVLTGALDSKFCALAEPFKQFTQVVAIPDAAHRIPWDQPVLFTKQITQFIQEIP